ncbi:sensor histidine kinase [Pseudoduganella armeniaca]|uniref:Histidine kinase n=1 Tax=Pseudoduganella armeniaca TaxID=2072590 RepID=A0A2R4C866_9BURK|nr:CHASE domain-containing protein [Pseudoduganella armeniaca]AVR95806.1 histidine kinase [Pseudoduganella armeniaca]
MHALFRPIGHALPANPQWWPGILLSLGAGALFYGAAARSIETDARQRFSNHARTAQFSIASRIKTYSDVLRAAASFFQANDYTPRDSFQRFVHGLDLQHNFPAIDNINFAQFVRDAERDGFERAMRDSDARLEGYPDFNILPATRRPTYEILTLLEPIAGFGEKYGNDITAKAHVAAVMAHSRDTGEIASSGRPIGILARPIGADLGMRLPVYRRDMPTDTVPQRRAAYMGSVGIGFSVPRLLQGALDEMPVPNVRLQLYDVGRRGADGTTTLGDSRLLLFDSVDTGRVDAPTETFQHMLPIDFNGRIWTAYFSAPKAALYSRLDAYLPWLAGLAGSVSCLLLYALFHTLASSRKRALKIAHAMTRELRDSQAKLQLSHQRLRRLAAHADQIKEEERKRIAREIHDDLGQNLLALRIEADILATRTAKRHPYLHARAKYTLNQIDNTIRSVRHIINDLRPNVLDLGLNAAVEWQVAQFRKRSGIACELIEHGGDVDIDDRCATAFFRVLQESLSNICQHARATQVKVELHQQQGLLQMSITDNGVGLQAASRNKSGSFGLVGIEERINLLGGTCAISSVPDGGTTITVSVPVSYKGALMPFIGQFAEH